jgi:heme-degrading monooxygenase HmoA
MGGGGRAGGAGFVILWEFVVAPHAAAAFRRAYGPDGAWVELFRRAPGHIETFLLEDRTSPGRFVTLDRWTDAAAWQAFRHRFAAEYEALDRAGEGWTESERLLGEFEERA